MTHRDLQSLTREQHEGHAPDSSDPGFRCHHSGDPGSTPGSRSEPTPTQILAFYAAALAVVLLCLGTWLGLYLVIT